MRGRARQPTRGSPRSSRLSSRSSLVSAASRRRSSSPTVSPRTACSWAAPALQHKLGAVRPALARDPAQPHLGGLPPDAPPSARARAPPSPPRPRRGPRPAAARVRLRGARGGEPARGHVRPARHHVLRRGRRRGRRARDGRRAGRPRPVLPRAARLRHAPRAHGARLPGPVEEAAPAPAAAGGGVPPAHRGPSRRPAKAQWRAPGVRGHARGPPRAGGRARRCVRQRRRQASEAAAQAH
uniref:Uncharacterized protein n=1 Tax=Zea mays TaxID=4577 RepID=C4J6F8_MAIZE|nr:unknown [Zea mays]